MAYAKWAQGLFGSGIVISFIGLILIIIGGPHMITDYSIITALNNSIPQWNQNRVNMNQSKINVVESGNITDQFSVDTTPDHAISSYITPYTPLKFVLRYSWNMTDTPFNTADVIPAISTYFYFNNYLSRKIFSAKLFAVTNFTTTLSDCTSKNGYLSNNNCYLYWFATGLCVRMYLQNNIWLIPNETTGCTPFPSGQNDSYNAEVYQQIHSTIGVPPGNFSFLNITFTVRNELDPYIIAADLTNGTFNLYPKIQVMDVKRNIGFGLLALGILLIIPLCVIFVRMRFIVTNQKKTDALLSDTDDNR